ncbi:L-type lectin-domain containing receptor kinase IV.2-like [Iris pallida]|uniref:L-type lectin-domain containing receptor kinase IV.2-like n=1 Tax=Iris pallida TaxID=29817 RepID=A0AAX6HS74_IRIPA|nr:L-type lectin-domain containing receptor kinase IV.2-like [Iris pallida]
MTNAKPWPLSLGFLETIANTKVVEKERGLPTGSDLKLNGAGWKAWPCMLNVVLVSWRRPFDAIDEMPSRLRLAPPKPR